MYTTISVSSTSDTHSQNLRFFSAHCPRHNISPSSTPLTSLEQFAVIGDFQVEKFFHDHATANFGRGRDKSVLNDSRPVVEQLPHFRVMGLI